MGKFYSRALKYFIFTCLILTGGLSVAQPCDPLTPSFTVNLTGQPSGTWISPVVQRYGLCCQAVAPDRCVEFMITLDPGAQGIVFDIASGAVPPGALYYQSSCGPPVPVGSLMCLNGVGPHRITFCKPGNNNNTYSITSIPAPQAGPPISVSQGCSGTIYATGYNEASITWSSVPPNPVYNSYMSCSAACDTVLVTAQPGYPASVLYQVCGTPNGACNTFTICDTVRVYFVSDKTATINPQNPVICFGGPPATLTATGTGGAPPYNYLWSTGQTTQSINVGAGTYWVRIGDGTNCPPVYDTVTVIANPSPISANAGPDLTSCTNNPSVTLNGSVVIATGGTWSGGAGVFSPNNTTLNAVYTPTAGEISTGTVNLTLTTTGNGGCPASTDNMVISIGPAPTVNAGPDVTVCSDVTSIPVSGTVTVAAGGTWTTSGSGTFTPNANTLNAVYHPSNADTAAGTVTLTLTSTGNGTCIAVTDTKVITLTDAPTVNAGPDLIVCSDVTAVSLTGTAVTTATGGTWTTSGSGTFTPNANTVNAVYHPSSADTAAGSVTLTLTTTGNGTCNAVTDTRIITFTNAPTANAGPDVIVCSDVTSIPLNGIVTTAAGGTWTTSGTGIFTPNANTLNAIYQPTNADTAAGTITLTLTTTGNGGCSAVTDTKIITLTDVPTANAGPDQTFCADVTSIPLSGTITTATGAVWTTSGSGTFTPNPNTINASYIPSNGDTAAGTITLTLTTTGNGTCNPVSDTRVITLTDAPTVNAGADITVCADVTSVPLSATVTTATGGAWTTSGTGTFTPDANTVNASYIPSSADTAAGSVTLTLTTTGNGTCNAVSDNLVITITDAPAVNAGADAVVCSDAGSVPLSGAVTTATGGTWTTSGSGTFTPNANTLNAAYLPSNADTAAGTVTLTLTTTGNGTCNPVSDNIVLTFTDAPTVNVGSDQVYCSDVTTIPLNAVVTTATGGTWATSGTGTFTPDANTVNASYTPSSADTAAGTVTLILTTTGNGGCNAVTDAVTFTLTDAPAINAGPDAFVCSTNPNAALSGNVTTATGAVWTTSGSGTFSPSAATLNATYIPSNADTAAGSVTLTLTSTGNGTCNPVSDNMLLTITPDAIVVNAGTDQSICAGSVALSGTVSVATGGVWTTTGSGIFNPSNTQLNTVYTFSAADTTAGSVSLILTTTGNGGCIARSDTVNFIILDPIIVNANAPDTICANGGVVTLSATSTTGQGVWSALGSGTFLSSITALNTTYVPSNADTAAGTVSLVFTSTNNGACSPVTDTVKVVLIPSPFPSFSNTSVCLNQTTAFTDLTTTIGNITSWNWNFDDTGSSAAQNPTHTYTADGTYNVSLTVTSNNGCVSTITQPVTVHPLPAAAFSSTAQCFVDSVYFTDLSTISSGSINTWSWSFGDAGTSPAQNPGHFYNTPGNYTIDLIVSSTFGCSDTITQLITVQPSPAAGFSNNVVCLNNITSFTDSSTILFGSIVSWAWDFGDGNNSSTQDPSHSYNNAGTYNVQLVVTSAAGCIDTIVQQVVVNPLPQGSFTADGQCLADGVVFTDLSTVTSGSINSWQWYFGDGNQSAEQNTVHTYTAPGSYSITLIVQSALGCADTVIQPLLVNPSPVAAFSPISVIVNPNENVSFTDNSTGSASWLWDFGDGTTSAQQNPTHSYALGGTYTVTEIVTNAFGCTDTIYHEVIVTLPPSVPTGFTPNGDGVNDVLYVLGGPFQKLEFRIYNNWGELVFVSGNQADGWDGTRNGVAQPVGVYVFTVVGVTEDGIEHKLSGDVTLLR